MSIQSITVPAGTPIYIPSNATVLSVSASDNGIATSDCTNIPYTAYKCYLFVWQTAEESTDFGDAFFSEVVVGDLTWSIPVVNQYEDGGGEGLKLATSLNSVTNKIWNILSYDQSGVNNSRGVQMRISDIGKVPQLKIIQGVGTATSVLLLQGIETACSTPSGWINV